MRHGQCYRVSDESREAYQRDGVICLRNVLTADESATMLAACLRFMADGKGRTREGKPAPSDRGRFFSAVYMSETVPEFREFRERSPLPSIAGQLMGVQQVRFFYDQLFIKEAGTQSPTPWHQDLPFWPFRGTHLLSLWVALTPVTRETSGVEYLAGSHRSGKFYRAVTPDHDPHFLNPDLEVCPDYNDAANRNDGKFLSWDMEPGDVLCHHPLTAHGAGGNSSTTSRRVGLSLRYLGRDVVWDPRPYVMRLNREPDVSAGTYPGDDKVFPSISVAA